MSANESQTHTDFQREQAVFLAAVDVASPAERNAVLDRQCGADAGLRQRVEALLAAHDAEGSLPPAGAPLAETRALETLAGATITGKYKLLEEIGAGGMGVVWMAEQRVPVRRLVAVKLIKAGMDSRSVVARFEAERQALAMMDHPNIARVFDGGMTEEGRPYFAMEFVRGLPVTQYCDQRRMTVRDRLLLFTEICQAVQHAHQKGIIHRDIKPSNVLVTEHDGKPVPKVIDFGLAKALGGAGVLTEHTLHTAFGAMAGTPLYTAPEQVAINALDIDTRADIYALGVLLYELLTGSPPLERERLEKAAWDEVCRVIREEEPPRPSMRISASLLLPSLAASRQSEPGKLSGLIRGDLDWIVLKALEKERNRRYDTATALVADIERHLNDEPVVAAPPTFGYRARKFVRKHRGPVIAGAAAAALLALGLATTTWQWRRADENASVAQRNEQIAAAELIEVERHRQEAQKQRDTAVEANRRAAEQAARLATFVAARCAEEGIHAVKGEDPSLALLYFARAIRLAPDPASAEMNRRRFNIALHRLPRPADVIPPDVAHTIYHGLALRFRWGSKLELIDARTTVAIPNVKFELAGMTVQYAEFSPDGRYVIADCYDGKGNSQARLYETATGRLACPPMPHTINCDITFTPDGRYVTTTPDGDRMVLKSVPDGHDGPDKMPWGRLCFNPNGHLVIINCGESARVWDVNTSKPVTEPFCPPPDCCAGAFSCDGTRVAANMGQDVRVLDTASGRPISPPIRADCTALEFSPDGRTILTGGKMWHVWNATTGEQELSLVQPGFPRRAAFSPDGKRLATANEDPDNVVVRDAGTGAPLCGPIHRSAQGLGFSADGRQLVTIPSVNEGIGVWDLSAFDQTMPAREPLLDDKSLPAFNNSLIFSQDGKLATRIRFSEDTRVSSFKPVTRAGFSVIQLWNSQTCARLSPPIRLDHTPFDKKPMFVENGARLFADNVLIDTVTGAPQGRNLSLSSTAAPFLLTISSDGQRVLTAAGNELQVLDSQTRRRTAHFPLPWAKTADAVTARFSPNGRHLVVNWGFRSSESNNACLIDLDNGQSTTLETSQSETDCKEELIEFNPDGQWFLLGYGGHLRAYRVSDGTRMPLPSGLLYAASGDTTHLVIESRDRGPALQTWKIHSASEGPRQVSTFSHCAPIAAGALGQFVTSSASFCSNRGLSAALSSDGRLYWENGSLIDTQTGAHVADQLDPTNGASFIMAGFSSDSRSVAMFLSQSPIVFDISPIAAPVEHLELLAEFLSERRMTSDGLVIPDEESEETRSKFFATCHDIFPPPTASAEAGQTVVVPAYRDAVAARVAAATDEPSRKDLAEQFAAGADIEVRAAAYEHAALLGESALKLDPDNLWAGDRLAIAYLWVGRYDDALGLYHRCKGRTFLVDAELRVFGQNVPDHVAALRKAKMDNPALAKIESLIAPTRQLKGKDLLNSAMLVILKPELSATRYATALESLAAVARSSPTDPDLLRILGAGKYRIDRFDEAVKDLTRSLELILAAKGRTYRTQWAFLAMAQVKLGRLDAARQSLAKMRASTADPDYPSCAELEAEALELADDAETERIDGAAKPLFDSLIADRLSKSRVLAAVTQEPKLELRTRMFQLAAEEDWLFSTTHALWPITDRDDQPKERYQAAAEAADELLAMKPESTPSRSHRSTILCTIGGAYYHVGRYEESIRLNRRAIAINTEQVEDNDAFSWCRIAMAQFKLGQVEEARASLKSAIEAGQGTTNEHLPGLLATATKLINPSASQPATKPSSTPASSAQPTTPATAPRLP